MRTTYTAEMDVQTLLDMDKQPYAMKLDKALLDDARRWYLKKLKRKGSLMDNILKTLNEAPAADDMEGQAYALLPMNLVLWIYEMGNNETESMNLYRTLAQRARELYRRKGMEEGRSRRIQLDNMPVSKRMKELIANPKEFERESMRQYWQLEALISTTACSVRGQPEFENNLMEDIARDAAPYTIEKLIQDETGPVWTAVYRDFEKSRGITILKAGLASEWNLLLTGLVLRAERRMGRIDGRKSGNLSPLAFYTRLLTWLNLATGPNSRDCLKWSRMAGRYLVW